MITDTMQDPYLISTQAKPTSTILQPKDASSYIEGTITGLYTTSRSYMIKA